ncbi:uncharacterized protein LOC126705164 [Quercus robur]|uniref:uncharacterized protein LOC126705164 n=1 Tax=Quercus robur TaxID=38942 RepID=UPI002161442D|nr:uncharacterized protein LOC126705164 [Quercus robur]
MVEAHGSLEEDVVKKDIAYLAKNFRKFLKFKNSEKFGDKGKFMNSGKEEKDFKKREGKESQSTQGITCFECNGHGHLKKECPNYLRSKGKVYATTLSDSDSFTSNSKDSCDEEGNFSEFMTIARVESSMDLNVLVEEFGEHSDKEFMGIVEESDAEEDEDTVGLRENYNSLLEKLGEYAKVAKVAVKKMKKTEEDYRSLLVRYKEAKCEIETLNGELTEAYTKVERVSTKKLDDVLSSQKTFSDKTGLRYTRESSSDVNISKEVKFVKAKEPIVVVSTVEKKKNVTDQRMLNKPHNQSVVKFEAKAKRSQKGPRTNHVCNHCGPQGHTRPNCHKLKALRNASDQRSRRPRNDKRTWAVEPSRDRNGNPGMMDVMKMTGAFSNCLESSTRRF